jgi:hypothetical protein
MSLPPGWWCGQLRAGLVIVFEINAGLGAEKVELELEGVGFKQIRRTTAVPARERIHVGRAKARKMNQVGFFFPNEC